MLKIARVKPVGFFFRIPLPRVFAAQQPEQVG